MFKLPAIFIGGGLGASARYVLTNAISQHAYFSQIPLGTLTANALGSFLIGFFFQLFHSLVLPPHLRLAITVGFIGAFTTFSTYMLEIIQLTTKRQYLSAVATFILQNLLGFVMIFAGFIISEGLVKYVKGGL